MIASQFILESRVTELRQGEDEQRLVRQLRDAAAPASRPARSIAEPIRKLPSAAVLGSHLTRLAAI